MDGEFAEENKEIDIIMKVDELIDIIKESIHKNLNEYVDNIPDSAQYASYAPWDDDEGREHIERWKVELGTYEFLFNAFKYYGEFDDDNIHESLKEEKKYMPNRIGIKVDFSYVEYSSGADEDGLADYDIDEGSYNYDIDIDIFNSNWFIALKTRKPELFKSIIDLLTLGIEEDIKDCKSESEFNKLFANF